MEWISLLTVGCDAVGASESWDIEIARLEDGAFAWRTTGCDEDCESGYDDGEDEEEDDEDVDEEEEEEEEDDGPIDTGSAEWIAEYILENADGFETELRDSLEELVKSRAEFLPLLVAVENLINPPEASRNVN